MMRTVCRAVIVAVGSALLASPSHGDEIPDQFDCAVLSLYDMLHLSGLQVDLKAVDNTLRSPHPE